MSALSVSVMTCSCLEDRPTLSGDVVGNVSATAASEMKRPSKRGGSASFSFIYVSLRNLHCCPRLACHGRTPKQRSIAVEFYLGSSPSPSTISTRMVTPVQLFLSWERSIIHAD